MFHFNLAIQIGYAKFRHSGLESYFTYRRTGLPNFTTGPGTGNRSRIASRFQYLNSKKTANTKNYQDASQSHIATMMTSMVRCKCCNKIDKIYTNQKGRDYTGLLI